MKVWKRPVNGLAEVNGGMALALLGSCTLGLVFLFSGCGGGDDGNKIQVTVSGSLFYEDRVYNTGGFTGQKPQLPIRHAVVQLVADNGGDMVAQAMTNAAGAYTLSGKAKDGEKLHVSIVAKADSPYNIKIVNQSGQGYAGSGSSFAASTAPRTEDLLAPADSLGGVFNILDTMVRAADWVLAKETVTLPSLSVVWAEGSQDGTYFDGSDNSIHLLGVSSDTDEYDDDVITHEYGHYVEQNVTYSTSPGGSHDPFDSIPEHPDLAWGEGVSYWFSAIIKGVPTQVDTNAFGASSWEMETPSAPSITMGDGNEVAIEAILWDISDPANEAHDALSGMESQIWDVLRKVFHDQKPSTNIHTFCAGWFARGHGQTSAIQAIFAHRGIACP